MHKVLIIAFLVLTIGSCKKQYTCECNTTSTTKYSYLGISTTTGPTTTTTSKQTAKLRRNDAKAVCEQDNGTTTANLSGIGETTITAACLLK
jgi:hypothetical protein